MPEKVFYGKLKNGAVLLDTRLLSDFINGGDYNGKRCIVTVKVLTGNVSENYRVWYRAYLVPLFQQAFEETGELMSSIETDIKLRTLSPVTHKGNIIKEIDDLDTTDMNLFIETLFSLSAELGIYINYKIQ